VTITGVTWAWLGGKDNFAIDREAGQKALQAHQWRPDGEADASTPGVLWAGAASKD
jgi:hypothetical protein